MICCHVPSVIFPSTKGTVRLGLISDAITCEWPLPSPHLRLCAYSSPCGAILSRASCRSLTRPDSYSIVVSAPVAPGTKINTEPLFSPELLIFCCTCRVMSMISEWPLVSNVMCSFIIFTAFPPAKTVWVFIF